MNMRDQSLEDTHIIAILVAIQMLAIANICRYKFSAKVALMLDNPFLVPSLCKLNHISLCFIQISTNLPANCLFPFRESNVFFWSHPRCFGLLGKFQHNIKISSKTARVSRLSVSCDYDGSSWLVLVVKSRMKYFELDLHIMAIGNSPNE